ncbi:hypothetical protein DESC_370184 [Desulfosarcina cetonica]|nr:hypothetical protein DESC_370184 [Desulfosarcina cetonica]
MVEHRDRTEGALVVTAPTGQNGSGIGTIHRAGSGVQGKGEAVGIGIGRTNSWQADRTAVVEGQSGHVAPFALDDEGRGQLGQGVFTLAHAHRIHRPTERQKRLKGQGSKEAEQIDVREGQALLEISDEFEQPWRMLPEVDRIDGQKVRCQGKDTAVGCIEIEPLVDRVQIGDRPPLGYQGGGGIAPHEARPQGRIGDIVEMLPGGDAGMVENADPHGGHRVGWAVPAKRRSIPRRSKTIARWHKASRRWRTWAVAGGS